MDTYEKFRALPGEKQLRIINAGMEVFGKYGYKHAKTEEIATKAGIAKGLLFYYFKNKESFYLYLCRFCEDLMQNSANAEEFSRITDFFDLIDYGARVKLKLVAEYPYITEFALAVFSAGQGSSENASGHFLRDALSASFDTYFQRVDLTPFKEDVDPREIYRMLLYLSEGYLLEKQRAGVSVSFEEMLREFNQWKTIFKKISYREEYQ